MLRSAEVTRSYPDTFVTYRYTRIHKCLTYIHTHIVCIMYRCIYIYTIISIYIYYNSEYQATKVHCGFIVDLRTNVEDIIGASVEFVEDGNSSAAH